MKWIRSPLYSVWHMPIGTPPQILLHGSEWERAMRLVVATLRDQQRKHGRGNYRFQRNTETY
jgi:hypothetical protein